MVAYVHLGLLANLDAQTNQAMNQLFGACPAPPFTDKQGQYLAFIYAERALTIDKRASKSREATGPVADGI